MLSHTIKLMHKYIDNVWKYGPSRVIINNKGDATTSYRARVYHGIVPDIIFIRKDGWSLGATWKFKNIAEKMYKEDWILAIYRPQ